MLNHKQIPVERESHVSFLQKEHGMEVKESTADAVLQQAQWEETPNGGMKSGFFGVDFVRCNKGFEWSQPILTQPPGVIILVRASVRTEMHYILQAGAEPGNITPEYVLLRPTVQASQGNIAARGNPLLESIRKCAPSILKSVTELMEEEVMKKEDPAKYMQEILKKASEGGGGKSHAFVLHTDDGGRERKVNIGVNIHLQEHKAKELLDEVRKNTSYVLANTDDMMWLLKEGNVNAYVERMITKSYAHQELLQWM